MKIPKILTNIRVVILIIVIILAFIAIQPSPRDGIAVRFVEKGSPAHDAGMTSPKENSRPLDHEVITHINGKAISNVKEYYSMVEETEIGKILRIKTNDDSYGVKVRAKTKTIKTGEKINKTIQKNVTVNETINGSVVKRNKTINETIEVNETKEKTLGKESLGLSVYDAPNSNIRMGLDLQGGVRVLLKPKEEVSSEVISQAIDSLDQRLNAFGLNDVVIRQAGDLSGNKYIQVEIAGLQKQEIQELIASKGEFEAIVDNQTVFTGGDDIKSVCRTPDCSGIDPQKGCSEVRDGYMCPFFFSISLSPEAAQKHAEVTENLSVITQNGERFLDKKLKLFLDEEKVNELNIGAGLRGRAETQIQISGSGTGQTQSQAMDSSLEEMKKLQAILQTGSLPVELEVVKADNLSPVLGDEFLESAILTGIVALLVVSALLFIRYKTPRIVGPAIVTTFLEVLILLGIAAMFGTNIDLAAIAGIIVVVGTGVDDLIVISDEVVRKGVGNELPWKQKIKNAFFIIMAAFFTTAVAMIPLAFAGAGIIRGFALTTLYGIFVGVFITRPAFSAMVEELMKKK